MNLRHLLGWCTIGLCWWICAFEIGFFQIIMWSIILMAVVGIYITLDSNARL